MARLQTRRINIGGTLGVAASHNRHNDDLNGRSFRRILLLKPSSLGDVVHALPVLHGLRRRFPEATIDWLIATPFAGLLEGETDLNEAILFDRHRFARLARSPRVARDFFRSPGIFAPAAMTWRSISKACSEQAFLPV